MRRQRPQPNTVFVGIDAHLPMPFLGHAPSPPCTIPFFLLPTLCPSLSVFFTSVLFNFLACHNTTAREKNCDTRVQCRRTDRQMNRRTKSRTSQKFLGVSEFRYTSALCHRQTPRNYPPRRKKNPHTPLCTILSNAGLSRKGANLNCSMDLQWQTNLVSSPRRDDIRKNSMK